MLLLTELGTRLKEARLSKGYSLDDLQEITKIQKRYLVAIEEGNYSIMPGTFYVRAFIKQYSEAVGLNPDEVLNEFKTEIPDNKQEEVAQSFSKSPTRRKLDSRSTSRLLESMPKFIAGLFIIIIIVAIWYLYQQKVPNQSDPLDEKGSKIQYEEKKPANKPAENKDDETEKPANEPVKEEEEVPEVTQVVTADSVQGQTTNYTLTGATTLTLRIEISGDTWVGIRDINGNEQIDDRVYKTGEVVEFDATANEYARIRLGDSNNAKVFVNDEELKYEQTINTQNIIITLQQQEQ